MASWRLLMKARQLTKDPGSELLYLGLPSTVGRVGKQKVIKRHHLKIPAHITSLVTAFFTQNETDTY